MNFQFTGINPIRDASGNITKFNLSFTGGKPADGNYLNGTISITTEQFTSTGGDATKINALITPAVQALLTPVAS